MNNKKKIIIFGRSPFINQIKLDKIDYNEYDICCINSAIPKILNDEPTVIDGCRDEKLLIRTLGHKFGVLLYQLNPESKWLNFADIGLL